MYAKKVETVIPVLDEPVGFDLERGDWVSPYGKGRAPDFVFSFSYSQKPIRNQGNYEIEMTLGFDSPEDGIQDTYVFVEKWAALSTLRLPYVAPQGGYESVYRWNMSRIDMQRERSPELRDDQNYIFRVRTKIDENGKIISANYGKIHGAIETGGYLQDLPRLKFLYYFNPEPNSQNLEFNPDKNLFGGRDRFAP
ncbi:MAG: hypothetical protein H8D67_29995 [Deltaproteobacteria bacterium]|nr:hypothetical protein [Deltaproteobacteria bacterium]